MSFSFEFYLASPFFNPAQVDLLERIEAAFDRFGITYFSPRKQQGFNEPGSIPPASGTAEHAAGLAKMNVEGVANSRRVFAVADYLLPEETSLRLCRENEVSLQVLKAATVLPDAGTVWEMGYARGLGREVVLFTSATSAEDATLNLMLTQTTVGVIYGLNELGNCLREYRRTGGGLVTKPWTGGHR